MFWQCWKKREVSFGLNFWDVLPASISAWIRRVWFWYEPDCELGLSWLWKSEEAQTASGSATNSGSFQQEEFSCWIKRVPRSCMGLLNSLFSVGASDVRRIHFIHPDKHPRVGTQTDWTFKKKDHWQIRIIDIDNQKKDHWQIRMTFSKKS